MITPGTILFGSSTVYTNPDTNLPGAIEAFDVGAATAGSLARMHVFLDAPLPATVLVGLYADSAGAPAGLLSTTAIVTPVVGWNDVAFGPVSLVAGRHYWVALLAPTGGANGTHFRDAKTGGIEEKPKEVERESDDLEILYDHRTLHVDVPSGNVTDEQQKPRFLLRAENRLHLNRGKKAWRWFADATVYLILFISVSGIYLWYMLRAERRVGLILLFAGTLTFFGIAYAISH